MVGEELAVGYLELGPREHGVSRYGRMLAAEARSRPRLRVREAEVMLDGTRAENRQRLRRAARTLADVDVVHVQCNIQLLRSLWGSGWAQTGNLWTFAYGTRAPLAVSLHDLFPPAASWASLAEMARTKAGSLLRHGIDHVLHRDGIQGENPPFALRSKIRRNLRPDAVALSWLARRCRCLLVCTHEERERVMAFLPSATVRVIPHFVEERVLAANRDDAKRALGLAGFHVVTLLGYIHPRKGHALLIDAMRELPESVVVVLAGKAQPEHAAYLQEIRRAADEAGVSHRLRMTGYLSEAQLNAYLAATDLAVCPFTKVSASGSISTWLSAGRRILASELPQVAEYNAWEPGAIEVFSPYTPTGLSSGINRVLGCTGEKQLRSINLLRERLTVSRVLDAHLEIYTQLRSEAAR